MSNRSYPRTMPPNWRDSDAHGKERCSSCGNSIPKGERVCVVEVQVNWMRGDDEVEKYCESCANARGMKSPPTKAERRLVHLRQEVLGLQRKVKRLRSQLASAELNLVEREAQLRTLEDSQ